MIVSLDPFKNQNGKKNGGSAGIEAMIRADCSYQLPVMFFANAQNS